MFKQILRDVENTFQFAGFDMSYEEFKELCREAWRKEEFKNLCADRSKNRSEGKFCFRNQSNNTLIECIPETYTSKSQISK